MDQRNTVVICGRRESKLALAKSRVPELHIRRSDVSKPRSRAALHRWATGKFPSLNIIVNNAGIQRAEDFLKGDRDLPQADAELAVNLAAPIHLCALFIPHLRCQEEAAIINISSGLAFTPLAQLPIYCATKAATHSLSMSLRHQLRRTHIKVFEAIPPIVRTELSARRGRLTDPRLLMSPDAVAAGILTALAKDAFEIPLGAAVGLYERRDALFDAIND